MLSCVWLFWAPMDCSPPGSSVLGILQARKLERVAITTSRGSSRPRDSTPISCIAGGFFTAKPLGKSCKRLFSFETGHQIYLGVVCFRTTYRYWSQNAYVQNNLLFLDFSSIWSLRPIISQWDWRGGLRTRHLTGEALRSYTVNTGRKQELQGAPHAGLPGSSLGWCLDQSCRWPGQTWRDRIRPQKKMTKHALEMLTWKSLPTT